MREEKFRRVFGALMLFVGIGIGVAAGVGSYTFVYARGFSYISDNPMTCANCHVMQGHYDAFLKSSHSAVASCNDCHTPEGFFSKHFVKAINGWNHAVAFTTGDFHEPIQIKPFNRAITEESCRKCHSDFVHNIDITYPDGQRISCIRCHDSVGHMR